MSINQFPFERCNVWKLNHNSSILIGSFCKNDEIKWKDVRCENVYSERTLETSKRISTIQLFPHEMAQWCYCVKVGICRVSIHHIACHYHLYSYCIRDVRWSPKKWNVSLGVFARFNWSFFFLGSFFLGLFFKLSRQYLPCCLNQQYNVVLYTASNRSITFNMHLAFISIDLFFFSLLLIRLHTQIIQIMLTVRLSKWTRAYLSSTF